MIILLFLVLLIQFFIYWIFEPLSLIAEYALEVRLFPVFGLLGLILLFSAKKIEHK
tara:strand:+ start:381 stop:548 length:168 start_codon:yes stop_codon:yes gene_type:complete